MLLDVATLELFTELQTVSKNGVRLNGRSKKKEEKEGLEFFTYDEVRMAVETVYPGYVGKSWMPLDPGYVGKSWMPLASVRDMFLLTFACVKKSFFRPTNDYCKSSNKNLPRISPLQ